MTKKTTISKTAVLGLLSAALLIGTGVGIGVQLPAVAEPAEAKTLASRQLPVTPVVTDECLGGKTFAVGRAVIQARPEQVWEALSDYSNSTNIFPLLKKCQVLEDHGKTKVMRHVIAPSGVPATYDYVVEISETSPRMIEWHRLRGSFKDIQGFWKLEPVDGGKSTLVTYASYADSGFFPPQMLIRRQFHIDMPKTLTALKTHVETSIHIASRRDDSTD